MGRIKELNRYQKGILLLLTGMLLVFGVVYAAVTARVGFLYKDVILIPGERDGNTVYSGRVHGEDGTFTVTADQTVVFEWGGKTYGPYTVREDPSAIPKDTSFGRKMTGVEIREGNEILFRGGICDLSSDGSFWMLINEDGTDASVSVTAVLSDGTEVDADGNVIDPVEPSVWDILQLVNGPELTKKGEWLAWFAGLFLSLVTAVSILFADELFRWNLAFRIQDPARAEPTEWEITGRYIGWTAMTVMTLAAYIMGLQ